MSTALWLFLRAAALIACLCCSIYYYCRWREAEAKAGGTAAAKPEDRVSDMRPGDLWDWN
ncbi:MAG: hypothetical protein LBG62_00005 [Candidatus Methanoplasma sp.]|nr:hypothetical protein [Candidatus Methanoplasma sp.]